MRRACLAAATALVCVLAPAVSQAAPAGAPASLRIWPLGDSITMGAIGPSTGTPGGYRSFLDAELAAAGVDHKFIGTLTTSSTPWLDARGEAAHDGHPAFYLHEVAAGVVGPVSAHNSRGGYWLRQLDPDLVLLHIGTNDVLYGVDPGVRYPTRDGKPDLDQPAQRAAFVAHLVGRLQRLVDAVHRLRPRAAFVVATVTPIGTESCSKTTDDYATAVRALVTRNQARGMVMGLADVFNAYTTTSPSGCEVLPGLVSQDRVHPTTAGYAVMSEVFDRAILALRTEIPDFAAQRINRS